MNVHGCTGTLYRIVRKRVARPWLAASASKLAATVGPAKGLGSLVVGSTGVVAASRPSSSTKAPKFKPMPAGFMPIPEDAPATAASSAGGGGRAGLSHTPLSLYQPGPLHPTSHPPSLHC